MSRSLNSVQLIGNVGADPEIRSTTGGNRVATLSLATSYTWNDRADVKQEKTEWHRLVVWDKLADIVEKWVKKGDKLYVQGRIEYRQWQDKDGQTRYTTEIRVGHLLMLGSPSGGNTGGSRHDDGSEPAGVDRMRQRQAAGTGAGRPSAAAAKAAAQTQGDFEDFPSALADEDDDLPF